MNSGGYSKYYEKLPESVRIYIKRVIDSDQAEKVVLFGSRARGDHRENSDFDLAVQWSDSESQKVRELESSIEEEAITLYKVDLLDLQTATKDYLNEIEKEGIVLWQKKG